MAFGVYWLTVVHLHEGNQFHDQQDSALQRVSYEVRSESR